ncbi:RtcB family protein, partial [Segatella copri]
MNEFTKIFAKTIEDEAIKQIETLSNSEAYNSCKIRIMPDCHAGKGCTIGTVIELDNRVVPNTVGVDIGCGMKVVRLGKVDIDLQKFDEAVNKLIPSGFNVNEGEVSAYINGLVDGCMFGKFRAWDCLDSMEIVYRSVGSLGGGNHFIELDANEEGEKFLVIHTGSRNLGVRVCNYYQ